MPRASFDRVPQGWGGTYAGPSPNQKAWIGTDGLGTCLGVYVAVNDQAGFIGNFVAHFDSLCLVTDGPGDAGYNYVRETTRDLMLACLGAYDSALHSNINTYSTSREPTTLATHNGIWLWAGQEPPLTSAYGFRARYDGSGLTATNFNDPSTDIAGQCACTIPLPVEPGPVIPPD